jgi:AcrR family transcriptional regulator
MARTLDPDAHAQRRQAFLEVAAQVIERKGYEGMTIQDILNTMQASKGAFYHYFDSKEALLEGLVEHVVEFTLTRLEAVTTVPHLTAPEKLRRIFSQSNQRKLEQKGLMLALGKALHAEGNGVIKERVQSRVRHRMANLLSTIVAQGVTEGAFRLPYPEHVGRPLVAVLQEFESIFWDVVMNARGTEPKARITDVVDAYNDVLARMLGIQAQGFALIDADQVSLWGEPQTDHTKWEPEPKLSHG